MSRRSPPRFLIDPAAIGAGRIRLTGPELHHLRVRRLGPGDPVCLIDARGGEYAGVVAQVRRDGADIAIAEAVRPRRDSRLRLALAQAVLKGAHLDLVIEKATELGVAEIVVFTAARTVARPPPSRRLRWQRIAASAAKQSGRLHLPAIGGPIDFDAVVARAAGGRVPAILFHPGEDDGTPLAPSCVPPPGAGTGLLAIVGPEGGFTGDEVARARAGGCVVAGLGPRILRAETAALTAIALCQFLWGDLGAPPRR